MKKNIAFFDFDGTITRADTMLELVKYVKGKAAYYKGIIMLSPWLMAMKAGLISRQQGKEKFLATFFRGMDVSMFNALCERFSAEKLPALIRQDALAAIKKHLSENDEVVVVSASAENWVAPWCKTLGIATLCSELEIIAGKLTGKLKGTNCNENEKVNRILLAYDPALYGDIFAYGDSSGDKQMLELSHNRGYRVFKS